MTSADPFPDAWDLLPLPEILSLVKTHGMTGRLTVESTAASRDILFVDGELRAARSSSEREKLGSWLVSQKIISEARKQGVLLIQEGSDSPPLGHMMVSQGIIDNESLEHHLESLAVVILQRATAENRLNCVFEEGLEDGQLDTLPNVSTPQLMLIAARTLQMPEDQRRTLGDPNQLVSRIDPLDATVQEFDLTRPESTLLGKLQRPQTLGRLKATIELKSDVFYSTAYCLKVAGLISLASRPQRKATIKIPTTVILSTDARSRAGRPSNAERSEILRLSANAENLDHYAFFGIKIESTYQEIFDAWDTYQQRFDPARSSEKNLSDLEPQLRVIFEHAKEAFELLYSPIERPRYDRSLRMGDGVGTARKARETLVRENLKQVDELVRNGDLFTAVKLLDQACDLDPKPANLVKLAKLMLINPQWANRALEKLRRAVEIDPTFVDGWLAVAEYWRSQKNNERERKALEQALAVSPKHPKATKLYRTLAGRRQLGRFLDRVRKSSSPEGA